MTRLHLKKSLILMFVVMIVFTFVTSWNASTEKNLSSLSGRVVDAQGKPVAGLKLAIKPVKFDLRRDTIPRTPFTSWLRSVTDAEGRFSFRNIDPVTSQFAMFPEHGSDYELISMTISDLTFHSTAFRRSFPTGYGKLTFEIEPGEHLENVVVNVKTPRTRIRGRVLLQDGTPLANEELWITVNRFRPSPSGRGGSGGGSGRNVKTDNQGYFVTYNASAPAENTVMMTYKGIFAKSEKIVLNEGERYDDLVFVIKNMERLKARENVWIGNPATGTAYRVIQCDSWEDANAKAEAENAYLVAINDEAEQKWLEEIFPEKAFFWIGLTVPREGTSWQWKNGQPLTYTNWVTSKKPEIVPTADSAIPIAMEFYSKRWMAIGNESPFLPAVKQTILEKKIVPAPIPQAE